MLLSEELKLFDELTGFLKELKVYKELLTNPDSKLFEEKRKNELFAAFPFLQAALPKKSKEEVKEEVREKLVLKHGVLKDEIAKLIGRTDINQFNRTWNRALSPVFGIGENKDALSLCIDYTLEAIGRLGKEEERLLLESLEKPEKHAKQPSKTTAEPPKAFIAHGGQSPTLVKLKIFLEALGVQPLVVEEQASEGRSVGENVDWYSRQADCAIILATKGDIDGKSGGFIPRGNVLMEIGKLQELFTGRIIYLLQAGTKFPTNVSEKVRVRFSPQSMDNSFIKIAKELKEFGILKAIKPQE